MSEPKQSPIAETHTNFEHLKNVRITTLDILTDYPANPVQIREMIRDSMKISEASGKIRDGGVHGNDQDAAEKIWAGVLEIETRFTGLTPDHETPVIAAPSTLLEQLIGKRI
jgi:predicted protein tyrosine phosphatase